MRVNVYSKSGARKPLYRNKFNQTQATSTSPPTGTVVCYVSSGTIPSGWLLCNGATVSRSTYSALFSAVSTTYGSGDGSTTFAIPDLRGRTVVGAGQGYGSGSSGTGLIGGVSTMSNVALGATGGATDVTITTSQIGQIAHNHTYSETAHTHTIDDTHTHTLGYGSFSSGTGTFSFNDITGTSTVTTSSSTFNLTVTNTVITASGANVSSVLSSSTASANAAESHTNIQPSLVLAYIIKT